MTCPDCGEEPQDLENWLRCKGVKVITLKQQMFGGGTMKDSGLLTKCPKASVNLARKSILGLKGASNRYTHTTTAPTYRNIEIIAISQR